MTDRISVLMCLFMVALALLSCSTGQEVYIPVSTTIQGLAKELQLEAFIYKPSGSGPFPVVVFNHGSAGGNPTQSIPSKEQASYFVERGFAVIVPMRRGRGKSQGMSLESEERNCDIKSWAPGLSAAFEDVTATIDYVQKLPFVDSSRVILAGVSRGGFLSVAYAATGPRRSQIAGVINFVGGWVAQAEDNCPIDYNQVSFADFGKQTKIPMLWLYGENDTFYLLDSIQSYLKAFRNSGGNVHFKLIQGVPENGHWLPDYPKLWAGVVDDYLVSMGYARP